MFAKSAELYDKIYSFKDYAAEAEALVAVIRAKQESGGRRLLDVACGTGRHIERFKRSFEAEGLDADEALLEIARRRNPEVRFHCTDMLDFDLGTAFDVVTCLFSSIGYAKTSDDLARAVAAMARHLVPGGVLLIEPWFTPEAWRPDTVHAIFIDEPELKVARINTSKVEGRLSYFDFHYVVGTPEQTDHFVERHELGLFETSEMLAAMMAAGLAASHQPEGLVGRGLLVGKRPR